MKLPEGPFTMTEFAATNGLGKLGKTHYATIRKRFSELGLIQVRRRRDKGHAENVWVNEKDALDPIELAKKLKDLRLN